MIPAKVGRQTATKLDSREGLAFLWVETNSHPWADDDRLTAAYDDSEVDSPTFGGEMATGSLVHEGIPATKEMVVAGDFDNIEFRGEIRSGRLVPEGILADQATMDSIGVGIYVIEKDGLLVKCNKTAIGAWGRSPSLGTSEKYCGAHILRYPSGDVMPHELAPPSVVIKNGGTVRNADVICEQPNGNRLLALVNIFPIRDHSDNVIGAVNIFRHNTSKTVPGLTS